MAGVQDTVVVVGAGVIGLSTALLFLSEEPSTKIIVVASHGPDDDKDGHPSIDWCSPHAGACQDAYLAPDFPSGDISMQIFRELEEKNVPGLRKIENRDWFTADDPKYLAIRDGKVTLKPSLRKFRKFNEDELIEGTVYGESYEITIIDPLPCLRYLLDRFISEGGQYIKAHLNSLSDVLSLDIPGLSQSTSHASSAHAATPSKPRAIINCSGLGSSTLLDVQDTTLHLSRGQYCDVYAPNAKISKGKWCNDWFITVFPLGKDGKVRIGATRELDDAGKEIRQETLEWQLRKALELEPALHPRYEVDSPAQQNATPGNEDWRDLKVLDVAIGRRPTRISGTDGKPTGPKIEIDSQSIGRDIMVVHNYGHSTLGFQTSWDSAKIVLDLYRKNNRELQ